MNYVRWVVDPGAPPDTAPVAPPWLLQPAGAAWLKGLGLSLDDCVIRAKDAVKASFPLLAPVDALPIIGQEVNMPRGAAESVADYRARLADAWNLWQYAGTAYGMLIILAAAGFPHVVLQTQTGMSITLSGSYDPANKDPINDLVITTLPPPVHLGGEPELWTQFTANIVPPFPARWGGVIPAYGSDEQKSFLALVLTWKSAHSMCVAIRVIDGPTWGFAGLVWGGFVWGSGTVVTWLPQPGATWGAFNWGDGTRYYVPFGI